MKRILTIAALVGSLSAASLAHAGFQSGNSLLAGCDRSDIAPCVMIYVEGIIDGNDMSATPAFCVPAGVTQGQAAEVFALFLQQHPAVLQNSAGQLAYQAFETAFPCP